MGYPAASDYANFSVPPRDVVRALGPFATPTNAGVFIFGVDYAIFWLAVAGAVLLPELWMRILASILAGVKQANLIVLAHDAAHGNMARSSRLSAFIAVCTLTPCLFNYRVWIWDHHRLHHPHPSSFMNEAWRPLSMAEWREASWGRRLRERLYRAPIMINFGCYLLAVREQVIREYWRSNGPAERRRAGWFYALLFTYLAVLWGTLLAAPLYSGVGSLQAWVLGFALPFFIFNTMFGYATYFQHTHVALPWYREPSLQERLDRQEFMAAAQVYPGWFSAFNYHVFYHVVHHVHPRIPVWRMKDAFVELQRLAGAVVVVDNFTSRFFLDTLRRCKLYDYDRHCWLDFDGRATTDPIALAVANLEPAPGPAAVPARA
jgi:omega-6 fatty acid desaturase (delta-12 desaturase)